MAIGDEALRVARELRVAVDQAVDQETRALVRSWARAWDTLTVEMDAAAAEIVALGDRVSIGQVRRMERARQALGHAHESIVKLLHDSSNRVTTTAGEVVDVTRLLDARQIAAQLPRTAGSTLELSVRFDRVNPLALDAIVDRTARQVTALAWPLADAATEAMLRTLVLAVPAGLSPREAARRMVRNAEGRFNGGLSRALTIARTEILDAHRAAARLNHAANSDVLAGWVWMAQLDERTCPSCIAQHGSEHPLEEDGPHDHQSGRCARMPKTKTWAELGFDILEPADEITPGSDWFDDLDEETQLLILGPGRLEALRSGRIGFADLSQRRSTPAWRDSFVATPLKDLV